MSSNNTLGTGFTTFEVELNRSISNELDCIGGLWEQINNRSNVFNYSGFTVENHIKELYEYFRIKPPTKEEKLEEFKSKVKHFKL